MVDISQNPNAGQKTKPNPLKKGKVKRTKYPKKL